MEPPVLPDDWLDLCVKEQQEIKWIIEREGIEVYKGNMLVILADLYDVLFPDAKWIFISRNADEIVRSMIATDKTKLANETYLLDSVKQWRSSWYNSRVSKSCLEVRYEDFLKSPEYTIQTIAKYLNHPLSPEVLRRCLDFFKPRPYKC